MIDLIERSLALTEGMNSYRKRLDNIYARLDPQLQTTRDVVD
jgi:hypothetical protein